MKTTLIISTRTHGRVEINGDGRSMGQHIRFLEDAAVCVDADPDREFTFPTDDGPINATYGDIGRIDLTWEP